LADEAVALTQELVCNGPQQVILGDRSAVGRNIGMEPGAATRIGQGSWHSARLCARPLDPERNVIVPEPSKEVRVSVVKEKTNAIVNGYKVRIHQQSAGVAIRPVCLPS
jgi:hypothetical protein